MNPELRTVTIARDIAEEEAATAYDALSVDIAELHQHVLELQREIAALRRGILEELVRLREALAQNP